MVGDLDLIQESTEDTTIRTQCRRPTKASHQRRIITIVIHDVLFAYAVADRHNALFDMREPCGLDLQ